MLKCIHGIACDTDPAQVTVCPECTLWADAAGLPKGARQIDAQAYARFMWGGDERPSTDPKTPWRRAGLERLMADLKGDAAGQAPAPDAEAQASKALQAAFIAVRNDLEAMTADRDRESARAGLWERIARNAQGIVADMDALLNL